MNKTVTRLYDNYSNARAAVTDLESLGIPHGDISLVASNAHGQHGAHGRESINEDGDVSRGAGTGAALGGAGGLLAGLGLLAIPGLGPIVAAGWLAATAAGAVIGAAGGAATGSIVGALKTAGHTDDEANVYAEGVRRGGTLVSAKVPDDRVDEVATILDRNKAVDLSTRQDAYRNTGWERFDETAPAYSSEEIDRERVGYAPTSRY